MNARDLMTSDPIYISPEATVRDAMDLLRDLTIRHLPVVSQGQLVGMISDRDLREVTLPPGIETFEDPEGREQRRGQAVADIMQGDPMSVGGEDTLVELIDVLVENKIGAVPVVDDATDELIGIISYIDVLRAVRDDL